MSPILEGAKRLVGRRSDLAEHVEGLEHAVEHSRGRLDDGLVDDGQRLADRVGARLKLSADHTVVAIAGATGSGKSSTFNALTGLDLAKVGVRRPTTAWASACVWGEDPGDEILEWLGIPVRHRTQHDSLLGAERGDQELSGLVLLDLPDHDSTEVNHHLEVERLIVMADLMVWVLDPQKYADAAIHDQYLRPMATHRDSMVVILNHIDEVAPGRRETMLSDVRRLLAADGLQDVPVIATSASRGDGIAELKALIVKRISDKKNARGRFRTDIRDVASRFDQATGEMETPKLSAKTKGELYDAVSHAAGVPVVVDAVERSTRARASRATGWPPVAWVSKLRPDPLKRLHLDLGREGRDLVATARASLPEPSKVQRSRVDAGIRGVTDEVTKGFTDPWALAVRRAATSREGDLTDAVDRAVGKTDLGDLGVPGWCRGFQFLQWVLLLVALAGAVWLGVLAGMGYLKLPQPSTPDWHGFPWPTLMLGGGVVLGLLLALLGRFLVGLSGRARARAVEKRLRAAIIDTTDRTVIAPMDAELEHYRLAREGIDRALRR